jgi:uncharacterized protein (TIGR03000 family)
VYQSSSLDAAPGLTFNPVTFVPGVTGLPAVTAPAADPVEKSEKSESKDTADAADVVRASGSVKAKAAAAHLTLELPADAKLFVDGAATKGTGPARQFHTPALPAGQSFFYEFRAEVEVNGQVVVEEKKVVVRAGDTLTEAFPKLVAAAAAAKATAVAAK